MAYHIKFGSIEVNCVRVQTCIRGSRKETVVFCISKSNDTSTHKAAEKIRHRVFLVGLVGLQSTLYKPSPAHDGLLCQSCVKYYERGTGVRRLMRGLVTLPLIETRSHYWSR